MLLCWRLSGLLFWCTVLVNLAYETLAMTLTLLPLPTPTAPTTIPCDLRHLLPSAADEAHPPEAAVGPSMRLHTYTRLPQCCTRSHKGCAILSLLAIFVLQRNTEIGLKNICSSLYNNGSLTLKVKRR